MPPIIAVDPGREKCGVAVVEQARGVLWKRVVGAAELVAVVRRLTAEYGSDTVVSGNGTSSKRAVADLQAVFRADQVKVVCIDEYRTTDLARVRYWRDNPPRGWRRLIPVSMQSPPVPVDDYAAIMIAERYLQTLPQNHCV